MTRQLHTQKKNEQERLVVVTDTTPEAVCILTESPSVLAEIFTLGMPLNFPDRTPYA